MNLDSPHTIVRPRHVPTPQVEIYEISGTLTASGSGTETVESVTGVIIPTGISGAGLCAVPGVEMYTESGGSVSASIKFYDESGALLSSATIGSLGSALDYTGYTIPAGSPQNLGSGGTFYSAWADLTTPIPSGASGFLCGTSAYCTQRTTYASGGSVTLTLELGDSGTAASSIKCLSGTWQARTSGMIYTNSHADLTCNYAYTAPSLIAQARVKMVLSAPNELTYPGTAGGAMRAIV